MTHEHVSKLVTLEPGETVVREVRRHMLVFWTKIFVIVILFFIPLFVSPAIVALVNKLAGAEIGTIVFGFAFTLWLATLWVMFFYRWTDYYLDVWIVTTKRIIDIEQLGFFHRTVSMCRLEKLEDVSVEVNGVLATFFKFGTVHIHTAGESHDFSINHAAEPWDVKNAIMEAHGKTMDAGSQIDP